MHKRTSIISLPLFIGTVLSIAIHSCALYGRSFYTHAQPKLKSGRSVVQLTLTSTPSALTGLTEEEVKNGPQPRHNLSPVPQPADNVDEKSASAGKEKQIANLTADEGITTQARMRSGTVPSYPHLSQLRGEQGTVLLSIDVLKTGKAGRIEILQSSGYRRLDRAAVTAAQHADYMPACILGRCVDSHLIQPMVFELTDAE